jgi:hypothetical protein
MRQLARRDSSRIAETRKNKTLQETDEGSKRCTKLTSHDTSIHSVDPMSPYSSAPQLQNTIVLRGRHLSVRIFQN